MLYVQKNLKNKPFSPKKCQVCPTSFFQLIIDSLTYNTYYYYIIYIYIHNNKYLKRVFFALGQTDSFFRCRGGLKFFFFSGKITKYFKKMEFASSY
jgi:hypothetical protein